MAAQEEERAKEQEENKPLIDNSNIEEVEEVSEQTTESTGLGASLATAASPAEYRTRKQEESKPLPEASEADEGLGGGTSDGAEAGDNSADVAVLVEERGSEEEENKTLHERLEINNDERLTSKSGEPQSKYYLRRSLFVNIQECKILKKKRTGPRQNQRLGLEYVTIQTEEIKYNRQIITQISVKLFVIEIYMTSALFTTGLSLLKMCVV